jgi:trehalose 6-phosphate phosphatase
MQHMFSHEGMAMLTTILQRHPLLAFDFDGTLTPIVARPADARLSQAVSARLAALAARMPVAIVTGRSVDDVRGRLGFEPRYIVGNHGAEDGSCARSTPGASVTLAPLRARLASRQRDLADAGVTVEDKGLSIALHYRLSRTREQALALIASLTASTDEVLRVFGGKLVVNVAPLHAPDKAQAMRTLVARSGAPCAVFAGDDVNDEPVFASSPPGWLTIRVGRDDPRSLAMYFLDSPAEMAMLLDRMVALLPPSHPD